MNTGSTTVAVMLSSSYGCHARGELATAIALHRCCCTVVVHRCREHRGHCRHHFHLSLVEGASRCSCALALEVRPKS
ncbi:unnamed protein product [Spirodela intermedia]|uniref:Uncharacterized protein n=1 Tax=Spirodela intermedia TaxID=51605 RepID=A0A7I8KCY2_SPIIN|nr:unnamed protein product [Spirodela intermedia]